jgi:hypothetical protein
MFPTDDIIVARDFARTLLTGATAPAGLLTEARLVLTAACLHIHARIGPDPSLGDLRDFIMDLRGGAANWVTLAASPIQFVRYAAAEFGDAGGATRSVLDLVLRSLEATL